MDLLASTAASIGGNDDVASGNVDEVMNDCESEMDSIGNKQRGKWTSQEVH